LIIVDHQDVHPSSVPDAHCFLDLRSAVANHRIQHRCAE
jgi:hypothetical protein